MWYRSLFRRCFGFLSRCSLSSIFSSKNLNRDWDYGSGNFGDDFDVRINLTASDPNIVMCVYRQRTSARQGLCSMGESTCDIRSYRRDGNLGTDDGADFDIKVYRRANSAPTCTTYSISMQNG